MDMVKQAIVIHFRTKREQPSCWTDEKKDISQHKLANTDCHTRHKAQHIMDDLILHAKQCMAKMFKMLYDTNPFLPSQRAYFSVITSHYIMIQQNRHSSLKRRAITVYIT